MDSGGVGCSVHDVGKVLPLYRSFHLAIEDGWLRGNRCTITAVPHYALGSITLCICYDSINRLIGPLHSYLYVGQLVLLCIRTYSAAL